MRTLTTLFVVLLSGSALMAAPPQAPTVPQAPRTVLVPCVCGDGLCKCKEGVCPNCPVAKTMAKPVEIKKITTPVKTATQGCTTGSCSIVPLQGSVQGGCSTGNCPTARTGLFGRRR